MIPVGITEIWPYVLAAASAIVLISNAVEKIIKAAKAVKAPENAQNEKIAELETRLQKVENKLENDKKQIADIREGNHVLTKGMFALLEHGINGNNIAQMKPIVPKILIEGKCLMVSSPAPLSAEYATELDRPIVGMKNATLSV